MIKNKNIVNEVLLSYPARKNQRGYLLQQEEERLLQNSEYLEAVNLLSSLTLELQKADFDGDEIKSAELSARLKEAKKSRDDLRRRLGFTPNVLPWECPLCKDEGEVNGAPCKCFYQKVTRACYKELGVEEPRLYGFEDDTLSAAAGTKGYFDKLQKYCQTFKPTSKNIILTGNTGTGKTFLAQAVTKKISEDGKVCIFIPATELNDVFVEMMYQPPIRQKEIFDVLTTCDFLVIDDLGAERMLKNVTAQNLYALITERQNLSKPFMITTNLNLDEISLRYADRLFSRLTGKNTATLSLVGKDLRKGV